MTPFEQSEIENEIQRLTNLLSNPELDVELSKSYKRQIFDLRCVITASRSFWDRVQQLEK